MPICELCKREIKETTAHHLIPKTRHKNKKNKKMFSRITVKENKIDLCRPCHDNIHANFTEKELERDYNTIEDLAIHPTIAKFTDWIQNKPNWTKVPNKRSNRRN